MRDEKKNADSRGFWWILVVAVIVGVAVGYVGGILKQPSYSSSAELSWDPSSLRYTDSNAYVPDSVSLGVQVNTQALQVLSDGVVDPAATALALSPESLRDALTVSSSASSTQITIVAKAASAEAARNIASQLVKSYQQQVSSSFSAQYSARAKSLQTPIDALEQKLANTLSSSPLSDDLASQLATLQAQQVVLGAQASQPVTPLSILRDASLVNTPTGPSAKTLSVVGGVLGLLIGLIVIALQRFSGRGRARVRGTTDLHPVSKDLEIA